MEKTVVIIPALNEEVSIGRVIADIPKEFVAEVVVVNNGSSDSTAKIASDFGATVVNEERKGYGHACLAGIDYIKNSSYLPDIIVFLDGDYSDYPGEIKHLLLPLTEGGYDLVIGSRTIGERQKGALLPQAIVGNYIATRLIKLFYGVSFTDLGPFRAMRYEKLLSLDMRDRTFGWTVEMQVKAAKRGFRCTEVPVSYRKRIGTSKITGTIAGSFM
ncbi:MAG: glycosyltransferase family 2 protein, partial [Candidatus Dadabacteria bacterium]|nr:glycosyltransferase family 2 protein [Candidatus Dadabacteria bacterium]